MKKARYFLGSLFLIAVLVWAAFLSWPSKNLSVTFFDVGQGDSIFIKTPSSYQVLIDGGPDRTVLSKLGKKMPFWDREIDLVVLTHPHSDHLTGLIEVLKKYRVSQILATDAVHTSPEFMKWLKIIKEKNIPFEISKDVNKIDANDGVMLDVLYPKESFQDKKIEDLNETSVVSKLSYAGVSFLLPGDLGEEKQINLIANRLPLTADFLKVPHHGSASSLNILFLKAVSPKVAVISVGKNNKFGHPSGQTLEKLEKQKIKIKRTDQDGDIEVIIKEDGNYFFQGGSEGM